MIYKRYGQPWTFIFMAVAWGLITRYADGGSWAWAVVGGLLFASFMSAFIAWRHRRGREGSG